MAAQIPSPKKRGLLHSKRFKTGLTAAGAIGGAALVLYKAIWTPDLEPLELAAAKLTNLDAGLARSLWGTMSQLKSPALWVAIGGLVWAAASSGHAFAPPSTRRPKTSTSNVFRTWKDPAQTNGGVARTWSNRCGLVGSVIRKGGAAPVVPLISKMPERIKTIEQYWEALRDLWGYTIEEARAHAPMRLASIAIPMTDGNRVGEAKVIGVVYCDSSDPEFFDKEITELCVLAASAIADHVRLAS